MKHLSDIKFLLLFALILINLSSFSYSQQINKDEKVNVPSWSGGKVYVVKFNNLSTEHQTKLIQRKIIGSDWATTLYEIMEGEKSLIESQNISYTIIEEGIKVFYYDSTRIIKSLGEESQYGSNQTIYNIPDNSLIGVTSNIIISGAPSSSIATRVKYKWNIDHNLVRDVYVTLTGGSWNTTEYRLFKTGDDWFVLVQRKMEHWVN